MVNRENIFSTYIIDIKSIYKNLSLVNRKRKYLEDSLQKNLFNI